MEDDSDEEEENKDKEKPAEAAAAPVAEEEEVEEIDPLDAFMMVRIRAYFYVFLETLYYLLIRVGSERRSEKSE